MEPKVIQMNDTNNLEVELITPEIARDWLEKNGKNRPVNQSVVKRYVAAMLHSQWELNGETIKFSVHGKLLDGQHRLKAVLESGVAIKSYVVRNLPEAVFDTIDCGNVRSISDVLALEGSINNNNLGSALRLMYVHDELGSIRKMSTRWARIITTRDLMETHRKHPDLEKSVTFLINLRGLAQILSIASAAFCHYQFAKKNPALAESFFIRLQKGMDTEKGQPLHELRIRLDNIHKNSHNGRVEAIALTIQAWNAFVSRQTLRTLSYDKGASFPVVE